MQEALSRLTNETAESVQRTVSVVINSHLQVLSGNWKWDLFSGAVYCSDVMCFPPDFEGTAGIIHPDDLNHVKAALPLIQDGEAVSLQFRMITTYGEVKTISGDNIACPENSPNNEFVPHQPIFEEQINKLVIQHESDFYDQRLRLVDISERLYQTGSWYFNKATGECWYSNNMFRLHGLPPQSLNAHINTFHQFIHREDREYVIEALEKAHTEQLPLHLEYRIVQVGGNIRYMAHAGNFFYNNKGQAIISGTLRDVTMEVEAHTWVSETEANVVLTEAILGYSEKENSWGYWFVNLATRNITYSDNCLALYGLKPSTKPNSFTLLNMVHPEDKERMQVLTDEMYRKHILPETVFRIIRPDGKVRYLRQVGKVYIHRDVKVIMAAVVQDITLTHSLERKISEFTEAADVQNLTYKLIEETNDISSIIWFNDGSTRWSDGVYRLLGFKPGGVEPTHRLFEKVVHPQDLKTFRDAITLIQNQQNHGDLNIRIISRLGLRHLKISFRQIIYKGSEAAVGLIQDVTKQLTVVSELIESKAFAGMLEDASNDIIILTDVNHTIINWNQQAEEKTGIKKSEVVNRNLFEVLPGLNDEKYLVQLQAVFDGEDVGISAARKGYLQQSHNYYLRAVKTDQNEIIGILHVVQDVSRELELQQRLRERLLFIEHLIEASVDRIVVLDRNMNYLYWNWRAEEYYATKRERVLGKNILELFPTFRNDPSYREFRKVLKGEIVHLTATLNPDTNEYSETWLTPIKDDNDSVYAVLWVVHDLSKEYHLQQEQLKAKRVLDTINQACYELDKDATVTFVNRKAEELFDLRKEDMIGSSIWELFPQAVESKCYEAIQVCALDKKESAHFEYKSEVFHKWISLIATPTDDGCIVLFHVIEEVVQARIRQEEEHRRLKEAQAIGHIGSFEWNATTNRSYWSDELYRIHGLEPQSQVMTVEREISFVSPDDIREVQEKLNQCRKQALALNVTHKIIRADGQERVVSRQVQSFADHGGKVTHLSGTVQDITEQVKAHVKISESESLLRSAEEVGFTGSYEVDLVNKTCHFSDGLFRIFGEDPQSFDPTLEYIYAKTHPDDIARCRMIQEEAIAEKRAYHYICRIFRRDGEERAVELHGKVILDKNQRPFKLLAVVQDITDHRRHELELKSKNIEIQKRNEEVASFAFIASHDLREPTRKILAFSDFLMSKERENLSREGKDYMDRIDKAVKRLDILINDMLGLSQIHMAQQPREPVNLNSVLEEVKTEMREWMLAVDAVVEAEELPVIQGVRQQLIHLFQNILSNAFKFHKENQAPRVRIKWEIQDADKFELENASPKRYLRLSFIDNGIGFHNRYNKKVFEIFQTLSIHGQGQGTGMGLTICRKVMENHNGFIVADSKENVGSTFCCYFPYEEN